MGTIGIQRKNPSKKIKQMDKLCIYIAKLEERWLYEEQYIKMNDWLVPNLIAHFGAPIFLSLTVC